MLRDAEQFPIPLPLYMVARIHLFCGLASVVGIVVRLFQANINIDLGVLGIPIYFGLMRLSSGWRTCALVFIWFGILLAPVVFIVGLTAQVPAYFQLYGIRLGNVSPLWLSVLSVPWFLFHVWQYRVLTRDEIRSLFQGDAPGRVTVKSGFSARR